MDDSYIYIIVALLPLAALMLTLQVNPYHALVIRGILGAIAALVYVVLGAADVALTEALVGTMLAVMLYVVAVRSSLVMRVGVLNDPCLESQEKTKETPLSQLIANLRAIAHRYHLRLELVPYPDAESLHQALLEKEIHITCVERSQPMIQASEKLSERLQLYETTTRIRRLYEILQTELIAATHLAYVTPSNAGEKHS